jgi:3-phosphoshikimate 1-carboxyvinyltransferase
MATLIDALRQLGAEIIGDSLPLKIVGKSLKGGSVTLDASQSSQFASSLLLAAPTWEHGLQLTLTGNPVSMPYLEMTIKIMEHYGVQVVREGNTITVTHQSYQPRPFSVSSDWSAASYWYEMMALGDGGEVLLKGLKPNSLQGDAIVARWFERLGVATTFEPEGARLTKMPADPQHLVFDFTDGPDLFPAVYATCYALGIDADFRGTDTLSSKESDRLKAMKTELSRIKEGVVLCAHGDHRIAMALASLWPKFGPIEIDDPSVVQKSYPGFWDYLFIL